MTNAERQRKYRSRLKDRGLVRVGVEITQVGSALLYECYERTNDPGDSFGEFCQKALIRGAVFSANTCKGKNKIRMPEGALRGNGHSA